MSKSLMPFPITVTGWGSEKVLADSVIIVFSYESCDENEQKAMQNVADLLQKVKTLKKDSWDKQRAPGGFDDFGFKFSAAPVYSHPKDALGGSLPKKLEHHVATLIVSVDVPIALANYIIERMISAGMKSFTEPTYYVSSHDGGGGKDATNLALSKAVRSARHKAQSIAAAAGTSIGQCLGITDFGTTSNLYYTNMSSSSNRNAYWTESGVVAKIGGDSDDTPKIKFPLVEPPLMEYKARVEAKFESSGQMNPMQLD